MKTYLHIILSAAILLPMAAMATDTENVKTPKFKPWVGPKPQVPSTCRFQGEKLEQGATACITINKQSKLMQCDLVLNNTIWIPIADNCPESKSI